MTLAQDIAPGKDLYHYGWYNAVDAALLIVAGYQMRARLVAFCGAAIIVVAGIAAGLMGADTHTVAGAPGATVNDDEIGATFVFPLARAETNPRSITVRLQNGASSVSIGAGRRFTGGLVLWQIPRTDVWVSAADAAGNQLTITQPTNGTFLSPVLLMQQTTTIAGMPVRFDTFAVPAVRRTVRAVLFSAQQAAHLGSQAPPPGTPAVLFAVADRSDRPVPGGIGVVPSGSERTIGGLRLRAVVGSYPAVSVASAPYLPVTILGGFVLLAGIVRSTRL